MLPIGMDWRAALLAGGLSLLAFGAIALLARLSTKLQGPASH